MKSLILPLGLTLACAGTAFGGVFSPVPLNPNSYNADVVVEASATPKLKVVTTATVDQGLQNNANTWMELGFDPGNPTYGLLPAGTVFTALSNANYSFQMPPTYVGPNGILIDTVVTNGTFTLATPASYARLSFLGSGGNGGDVIGVTVHFQDGTSEGINAGGASSSYTFGCPDWFNGTLNLAFIANERCGSSVNFTYNNAGSNNPRLYFRDIVLANTNKVITSVDLTYYSGGSGSHNCIFGMSGDPNGQGIVSPITVTGYTQDFVVEAAAALRNRVVDTNSANATTSSMDNDSNGGNSWYEKGYNLNNVGNWSPNTAIALASGLPHPGATVSNAAGNHVYVMAPTYNGNDAIYVSPTIPNATITFANPTLATGLSFLGSCGNGPVAPVVVVHFNDGTSYTNILTIYDWFNTGVPYVFASNGRVAVDTAQINNITTNLASALVPRLFNLDLALPANVPPVTSIDLTYTNTGGRAAIFAVSSTTAPVPPSIVSQPGPFGQYPGSTAIFTAAASGTLPINYQWLKGTNGVYVTLTDGGTISGSKTTTLTVANFVAADGADYVMVASNGGGSATSQVATLTVLSPLTDVCTPGDPITAYNPNGGSTPTAESVDHAIDQLVGSDPGKYLNFGKIVNGLFVGPVGFVTSPSIGRTIVTGIRFYTANDTVGRDPLNYILEGSNDGGQTYATISTNLLHLPDGRNSAASAPMDPTTQFMQQVLFTNVKAYTTYRVSFTTIKDTTQNSMQIGEVEILGVIDTSPLPYVSTPNYNNANPPIADANAIDGSTGVSFSVNTTPVSPAPSVQWQRKFGAGNWVNLTDGGNISGSQTTTLTLGVVHFGDVSSFRAIAFNNSGSATSGVATLTIFSSLPDITQAGDTVVGFGDNATGPNDPATLINDTLDNYLTRGTGINAQAGFPPFVGPVGIIVTPASGPSLVLGLRVFTGSGAQINDPIDYALEGSEDGGTTFTPIISGPLSLPAARNTVAAALDPTTAAVQEILFPNTHAYTTYRLSFLHTADDLNNSSLQLSEIELLGVSTTAVSPQLTFTAAAGGKLTISSTVAGTLQSASALGHPTVWTTVGPINGSLTITPAATGNKFYRVTVP